MKVITFCLSVFFFLKPLSHTCFFFHFFLFDLQIRINNNVFFMVGPFCCGCREYMGDVVMPSSKTGACICQPGAGYFTM